MSDTDGLVLLLDTNVWLDNYLGWRKGHDVAASVVKECLFRGCTILYATNSIKDVFYLIGRSAKSIYRREGRVVDDALAASINELSWGCINNMRELATAVGADQSDVWFAAKYRSVNQDFEDNLILAAAKRANADYLVTSDAQLLRKASVPALMPSDALQVLRANV